jgi:DNA-binding CsgD family transcriptional regulator
MRDLSWLQKWTELVSSADTVAEFGKKFVHSNLSPQSTVGAHIYQLDTKGQIELLGGYGLNPLGSNLRVSAWDDHSLSTAIRTRTLTTETIETEEGIYYLYVTAVMKGDEPLGACALSQRAEEKELPPEDIVAATGQILGLWLNSMGLSSDWKPSGSSNNNEPDPDSLTDRQLKVLELMSRGMTNSEIAQELILSESSIRQETVKIYKALGVGSRSEAARRALHLGILRAPAA